MSSMRFTPKGLEALKALGNKGLVERTLKREMRRATELNGKLAAKHVRSTIKNKTKSGISDNAKLTIMIKRSRKPLVDFADLFGGITSQMTDDNSAFFGVLRTSADFDVAMIVHEGVSIPVTPAMRGMFFALYKASVAQKNGGSGEASLEGRALEIWERSKRRNFFPLAESTTAIVIPGRPFIDLSIDGTLKSIVTKKWQEALQRVFRSLAERAKR